MKRKFEVAYEYIPLALVEIDDSAAKVIRDMIEFYEGPVPEKSDPELLQNWLKRLGVFILRNQRAPLDDEGWCKLDGSYGIRLIEWERYEFDESEIEIRQRGGAQ